MQEKNSEKYYTTIGLEIHAELKTTTKMFCSCRNNPDETKPNTNICPVCMAHPGALPVINKKAVENVIRVGLAIGAEIADFSEFDRKNYFYPDIPKGYQISQYKYPIVKGGKLAGMDITRIHLEEDTANNKHLSGVGHPEIQDEYSLIDFNRAGVPLMELVTEAHTFETSEEAAKVASNFAKEYQLLLQYIDASEANMEKGEMRVEANVSVSPDKDKKWTAYVEVKNLNSFKSVEKAIKYEVERMIELFEEGKESEIVKETRGFDEAKQRTVSQRKKESSEDYRYFPDPDLPKMKLHEAFDLKKMKQELAKWFEEVANLLFSPPARGGVSEGRGGGSEKIKTASNYITSDYLGIKKFQPEARPLAATNFAELINLVTENKISSRATKDILAMIVIDDASPLKIATEKNLLQKNDEGELKGIVEKILAENQQVVATYKGGKENALMSLVGKIIKETNGSANPQVVIKLLKELIK